MMCADFLDLKAELDAFKQHGVHLLHMDMMDGRYVPNFALGMDFCKAVAAYSDIPLDFHLMIEDVDQHLELFCSIKNSYVTFHPETSRQPVRTIQKIRELGCKPGIAIAPAVSVDSVKHLLPLVEQVCVMSVNPGYAGQPLLPFCIDKIPEVKELLKQCNSGAQIEIDGNVSWENIPKMVKAGADVLVTGTSSIFMDKNRGENLERLNDLIRGR